MHTLRRLGIATVLTLTVASAPSFHAAAATDHVAGLMVFDEASTCPGPPAGYGDFTDYTVIVSGDLVGCWYTDILSGTDLGEPSGRYIEHGREVFAGSIRGGAVGTFSTEYRWTSKWDPDVASLNEVWGRCHHQIVQGSGTGGLRGVTGLIARTDIASDASVGSYSGVLRHS
jgi:hypothetical protein